MKKRYFQKSGVDICSAKSMFEFINGHFTYWTMNSWNRLKSIANNVKLYNLGLDGDWCVALDFLYDEHDIGGLQAIMHDLIWEWEQDHPGYSLGFNGRSGGYLVIYNHNAREHTVNFRNILPDWLTGFDTYEEWKEYVLEYCVYSVKDLIPELRSYVELIRSFDKLCDQLRTVVNTYSTADYEAEKAAYEAEMLAELNYNLEKLNKEYANLWWTNLTKW